ncbi:transcription factor TFIIIC subunit tfc4 [Glugoides intestinalis]
MGVIEKYYGVEDTKQLTEKRLQRRSNRYLAKLEENQLLKETNALFVKGNTAQCFDTLKKAIKLIPNDFRPYYILGLIHEENGNNEKALLSYIAAAILKKNDHVLWKKALNISLKTDSYHNQVLALDKVFRKEPSEYILIKKLEILRRLKKKYAIVACQIDLFEYHGVDLKIFERFEHTKHINSLRKVCSSLYKCIKTNLTARNEFFVRKTVFTLYKIKDWKRILKILDEHYFKEGETLQPDIRFIYMISHLYSKEYRIDNMLDLKSLINDVYLWRELENIEYVYDLASCLKDVNELQKAIYVGEQLTTIFRSVKAFHFLGDLYQDANEIKLAIYCFNEVLSIDPVDEAAKAKLHNIYESLGYNKLAEEFETPTKVTEYIKELEEAKKSEFRYSAEKCKEIREIYLNTTLLKDEEFLEAVKPLLEDFFSNPFVIIKNKNFKSFTNKNERVDICATQEIIQFNEVFSKKQVSDILIRISSLHGLDINEWFAVIRNTIIFMIITEKYEDALELVEKCFETHILKSKDYILQILFFGIRLYLMSNNFEGIIKLSREMIKVYGYSSMYFLHFLTRFFPDFYMNRSFASLQKNVQRIIRKNHKQTVENDESALDSIEEIQNTQIHGLLTTSAFVPRFLQSDTVDFVFSHIYSERNDINILKAVICVAHTKCRTLIDKKKYAMMGMSCLKGMADDAIKKYNLAKGYHFFGFYAHAEQLYLEVIVTGNEELKKMSIFNLSLIFKENKSRKVLESLLANC